MTLTLKIWYDMIYQVQSLCLTGRSSNRQCNGKQDGTRCRKLCKDPDCQQVLKVFQTSMKTLPTVNNRSRSFKILSKNMDWVNNKKRHWSDFSLIKEHTYDWFAFTLWFQCGFNQKLSFQSKCCSGCCTRGVRLRGRCSRVATTLQQQRPITHSVAQSTGN